MLKGKTIIIGLSGGIAVYKACDIIRKLKKQGAEVWVVMTPAAQKFISPLTFRALSENPVITDLFDEKQNNLPVPHIALRNKADLVLVAPATANILGKAANGIADNVLSTLLLSIKCPLVFAPAMNPVMWENKAVQSNLLRLKKNGAKIIYPEKGAVVCGDEGEGRLAEISTIIENVNNILNSKSDLEGVNILITAGATREAIDPIRFISNRSSGKMGYALASCAKTRGANVTLISGPGSLKPPSNVKFVQVVTAQEMHEAVNEHRDRAQVIIMTAAIADYRPRITFMQKLQKRSDSLNLELIKTIDVLDELGKSKNGTYLVGFAAESTNLIENGKEKMQKKNLDLIIINDVSAFEEDHSEVIILDRSGKIEPLPRQEKALIADTILDKIKNTKFASSL
ncbi:MAG: bifunctional phosphopantothenoylcysteine decarboxylase/phosphopantothenate--cysteine ligase CoaBC [Candidatus Saganbacteria bacterium]|nr:bifunctional phosphopantothenoylcysteine decarboxylase/phosphopantothenate--cysteine ligase CoaBC [Candidatus Saganbacteria bacterium]